MRKFGLAVTVIAAICCSQSALADIYAETFETTPGGTGYAAILGSPNGLQYDFFPARAFTRLASFPVNVIGTGDEAFYWGNNTILPAPLYGLPGGTYSSNPTSYIFNGYGTGYAPYDLGIDFTEGLTVLHSLDFGTANGSNAPTNAVMVTGFSSGVALWAVSAALTGSMTLATPAVPVDRIEISRAHNTEPMFDHLPLGWYTLDNITYEITGPVSGEYQWAYYSREGYLGSFAAPVPEPEAWLLMALGLAGLMFGKRRGT